MADDPVVKISNVKRSIRAILHIHRTEPRIVAGQKVGGFVRNFGGSNLSHSIAIQTRGHDIADEHIVAKFRRPVIVRIIQDARNRRGAMAMLHQNWSVTKAIVRLPETGVIATP